MFKVWTGQETIPYSVQGLLGSSQRLDDGGECLTKCPQHIDIINSLEEAHRVLSVNG